MNTFELSIEPRTDGAPRSDRQAINRFRPSFHELRVLVVDDNDDVADCLAMMLRQLGHLPRACCSGRDCLDCLYEFRPDLILLDLSLPEQDGFEICRMIQDCEGFESVPIIACSALDRYIFAQSAGGCRFSKHLVKPVGLRQLQEAIAETVAVSAASAIL